MNNFSACSARPRLITAAAAIAIAAVGSLGAAAGTAVAKRAAQRARTLTVVAMDSVATKVDLGEDGTSVGDIYVFSSVLVDARGRRIGSVYGTQTSVAIEGERQTVQAQLTFRLGRGNEIVVAGLSEYPVDASSGGIVKNEPYERPIVGGTGKYSGARGTLTSTRQSEGHYRQRFLLLP